MDVRENHALSTPIPKGPPACEHCKTNPSKYKCPCCLVQSCSLSCVKAHKQETGCPGRRNVTKFVPLSQFDDNLILSDYNFLEETKRVSESAQRLRTKLRLFSNSYWPPKLKYLNSAASKRKIKLMFLPNGMSMREINRTWFNQSERCILWTIEWRFHSTDVVLHDHCVNENMNLSSILQNHMKPVSSKHPLRSFTEEQLDRLKCFIRKSPKGTRTLFRKIDMNAPIKNVLAKLVILEYPVIHVFLPSHTIDFEVDPFTAFLKPRFKGSEDHQSPKGIAFREEEVIQDTENSPNSPPVVSNNHEKLSPQFQVPDNVEKVSIEDVEIDQGLRDSYSELAKSNPDYFFDFGDDFLEGMNTKGLGNLIDLNGIFSDDEVEELEEGEIVE